MDNGALDHKYGYFQKVQGKYVEGANSKKLGDAETPF